MGAIWTFLCVLVVLVPLPPPFDAYDEPTDGGRGSLVLYPVSWDDDLRWLIQVAVYLKPVGEEHEFGYGILVHDDDLDCRWMLFERDAAIAAYHPSVKPFVLDLAEDGCQRVLEAVRPSRVFRRTFDTCPHGVVPTRFQRMTARFERCGYPLTRSFQEWGGHWVWHHERSDDRGRPR